MIAYYRRGCYILIQNSEKKKASSLISSSSGPNPLPEPTALTVFLKTMTCVAYNSHVFLGQVNQCLISQVTRLCICVIIRFSVNFFFISSYLISCLAWSSLRMDALCLPVVCFLPVLENDVQPKGSVTVSIKSRSCTSFKLGLLLPALLKYLECFLEVPFCKAR